MTLLDEANRFTLKQRINALKRLNGFLPNSHENDRREREIGLLEIELSNIDKKK